RVGLDPADARRPVGSYSTGMRQRLALAMALVDQPELIILDEPSSGLDPHGIGRLRRIVREERDLGATVFFSSHLLEQVEAVSDRVGIMRDGRLTAVDTVEGLRATVGSGTELRLRLDGEPTVDVESIEGVAAVEAVDGLLAVETVDSTAKAEVVARLAADGVAILDVTSTTASLEEVFTAYTADGAAAEVTAR
ncbi:MAG: AAA family ATPase, partial [Halobacteriota archaeon]